MQLHENRRQSSCHAGAGHQNTRRPSSLDFGLLAWGLLVWSLLVWGAGAAAAQAPAENQERVSFCGRDWNTSGEVRLSEGKDGRQVVELRSGFLSLEEADFANGRIAFEVQTDGVRSFVGAGFRVEGPNREDFYLRPHQSGRFDALQYTPVEQGVSGWQLYPEHNANFTIPTGRWLHVELMVAGPRMEVYLDHRKEPSMVVERLLRGKSRGGLGLWSAFPAGEPADLYPTRFSKVVIEKDDREHKIPEAPGPKTDSGLIATWSLSPTMALGSDPDVLPGPAGAKEWRTVRTDEQGRLNLARWAPEPPGGGRNTVLVRVSLVSDREQVVRLGFGFSDRATVFLRGQPVFRGDNTFRSRSQRYLGVMRVDNDVLFLPLRAGSNELTFAVTEAFGGWGLTARLLDQQGVRVEPARGQTAGP